MTAPGAATGQALLVFTSGGTRMAIDAARVREVAALPPITVVPQAAACLVGVARFRSQVLPVVSAARLVDGRDAPARQALLLGGERPCALAIDKVIGLVTGGEDRAPDFEALLAKAFPVGERSAGIKAAASTPAALPDAADFRDDEALLLVMEVGRQHFALPLDQIEEVCLPADDVAALPQAIGAALGTMAYRGGLLPLLSLAGLLAMDAPLAENARVVVARIGGTRVGLVVDRLRHVLRTPKARIDPVPVALVRGEAEAVVQAICRPPAGGRLVSVLDAGHLLPEDVTARLRAVMTTPERADATAPDTADAQGQTFLSFRAGAHRLAVPAVAVDAVARAPRAISAIPEAPSWLRGVANLRGEAVPVIDLAERLDRAAEAGDRQRLIVASHGGSSAAFLVEEIYGMVRLSAEAAATAVPTGGRADETFEGFAALEDAPGDGPADSSAGMALLVSPFALIDAAARDLLAAATRKAGAA